MKTIDIKISELCDEIDYWKERCFDAREELENIKAKYHKQTINSIKHNEHMMGNFLKLALTSDLTKLQKAFKEE